MAVWTSLTRRLGQERVQTTKTRESNTRSLSASIEMGDTTEVTDNCPADPPSKQMQVASHLKDRNVLTKVRSLATKPGEPDTTTVLS